MVFTILAYLVKSKLKSAPKADQPSVKAKPIKAKNIANFKRVRGS